MNKNNTTWFSAQVPEQLAVEARVVAAKLNLSRSELIRRAVVEFIEKFEKSPEALPGGVSLVEKMDGV